MVLTNGSIGLLPDKGQEKPVNNISIKYQEKQEVIRVIALAASLYSKDELNIRGQLSMFCPGLSSS